MSPICYNSSRHAAQTLSGQARYVLPLKSVQTFPGSGKKIFDAPATWNACQTPHRRELMLVKKFLSRSAMTAGAAPPIAEPTHKKHANKTRNKAK